MDERNRDAMTGTFRSWPPENMLDFNRDVAAACGRTWGAYFDTWNRCGQNLLDFAAARMRNNTELGESLRKCRTWSETTDVQSRWLRSMYDDYTREAGRMIEVFSSMSRQSGDAKRSASKSKLVTSKIEHSTGV